MKSRIVTIFVAVTVGTACFAQGKQDKTVNMNSVEVAKETLDGFSLSTHYYTIENNIDNQYSAAFVEAHPSTNEVIRYAQRVPSYAFVVMADSTITGLITMHQVKEANETSYIYVVKNLKKGEKKEVWSKIGGDITQLRALELIKSGYDNQAKNVLMNGNPILLFNRSAYEIQPYGMVRDEVVKLIKKNKLDKA